MFYSLLFQFLNRSLSKSLFPFFLLFCLSVQRFHFIYIFFCLSSFSIYEGIFNDFISLPVFLSLSPQRPLCISISQYISRYSSRLLSLYNSLTLCFFLPNFETILNTKVSLKFMVLCNIMHSLD